ncbi:Lanosterol synthase (Oxidosqualene--lanosterol cyclase) [Phlyctochytrium bullatum]|nr:Lanosterol synthase (Oxidosqualene--lanosterol cyclase) [Phlyctochytrium bullatum]
MSIPTTDPYRWRLAVEEGRQTWQYFEDPEDPRLKAWPMTDADRYWQGLPLENPPSFQPAKTAREAARNGLRFYKRLQTEDGHWAGEYGGPMFLIPGLAISMYITGAPWPAGQKEELIRYLCARANPVDGGWGLHIEHHSTAFGTALNYVALRILGLGPDHPVCVKARAYLHSIGGAVGVPAWGKFWLSVLNVYDWKGNNPIPPELWLLPYSITPFHPGRMWVHTRAVYLPMSYLYGIRFQAKVDDLILALRKELYVTDYDKINWDAQRNNVAAVDLYAPHTYIMDFLNYILTIYERLPNSWLRKPALEAALQQVRHEDHNTKYLDIGPVNKVMNMLIVWVVDGPDSESFKQHCYRNLDFMWKSGEGLMMNGTNGSQLWDTAFTVQAIVESGLGTEPEFTEMLIRAHEFLDVTQIKTNPLIDYKTCFRQTTQGAWPFSTRDQSYTVSDCTAEGLKAVCMLQNPKISPVRLPYHINDRRLMDAVDVLLTMQNSDGGFASYETIRGPAFLEWLNPAEVFGNIMIEYNYPECTTSVVLGLTSFRKNVPGYRSDEIEKTIQRAIKYIFRAQREDGSWYGAWGICFTYATLFALESLASVGYTWENSEPVRRACQFLLSKQEEDGGWGETFKSCETGVYHHNEKSQVVNTAWAVLSLLTARYPEKEPIERAVALLMRRQQSTGEWLQESIEGVFNKNCMISYPNYKFFFTIWALGRYANRYNDAPEPAIARHLSRRMGDYCFATLVTSDAYLPGALALGHSLRSHGTRHALVALVPPNVLSSATISYLYRIYDKLIYVSMLRSGTAPGDAANLELLGRKELDVTFTKLHVFDPEAMEGFSRVAFLDADSFVVRNVDDIFAYLDGGALFAAAPDAGWPDIFNSGVFVTVPRKDVFEAVVKEAFEKGSFDGGDQGILNSFFHSWSGFPSTTPTSNNYPATRLPFTFNLTPSAVYSYAPAYVQFRSNVAIVHFAGHTKPWKLGRFSDGTVIQGGMGDETANLHNLWWRYYDSVQGKFKAEDEAAQERHTPPQEGEAFDTKGYFAYPSPPSEQHHETHHRESHHHEVHHHHHHVQHHEVHHHHHEQQHHHHVHTPQPQMPQLLKYDWDEKEFKFPRPPSPIKGLGPLKPQPVSKTPLPSPATPIPPQSTGSSYGFPVSTGSYTSTPPASTTKVAVGSGVNASVGIATSAVSTLASDQQYGTVTTTTQKIAAGGLASAKTTVAATTTVRTLKTITTHQSIRVPSPTRRFEEDGELSPDGEISFHPKIGVTQHTTVVRNGELVKDETLEGVAAEEAVAASAGGEEFRRSRYDWDPAEFTPRQRRLSESAATVKAAITPTGDGVPVLDGGVVYQDEDDEDLFDEDEVDEEGVRLKPALKVEGAMTRVTSSGSIVGMARVPSSGSIAGMARVPSSGSIASMGSGDSKKRLSGGYGTGLSMVGSATGGYSTTSSVVGSTVTGTTSVGYATEASAVSSTSNGATSTTTTSTVGGLKTTRTVTTTTTTVRTVGGVKTSSVTTGAVTTSSTVSGTQAATTAKTGGVTTTTTTRTVKKAGGETVSSTTSTTSSSK